MPTSLETSGVNPDDPDENKYTALLDSQQDLQRVLKPTVMRLLVAAQFLPRRERPSASGVVANIRLSTSRHMR